MPAKPAPRHVGDLLEVAASGGGPPRRGRMVEVLGGPHHEHYLVKWTDEHRSIHYPSDDRWIVHAEDTSAPGPALP